MKWIGRLLLGFLILIILFIGISFFQYRSAVQKVAEQLPGQSTVVQTSVGPVEYLKQGNSDKFVLLLHGTPGSYHTFRADALIDEGFTVISPSRPGYFRTPLSSGETIEAQSELYAALLDQLSIDSAAVIGFSGGGPSAILFASRFPQRCSGLVVLASSGRAFDEPEQNAIANMLMGSEFGRWMAYTSLSDEFEGAIADEAHRYLQSAFFPMEHVVPGEQNDFKQFTSNWNADLGAIECPTLVIHGTEDELIPFTEATYLQQQIPNTVLMEKQDQDHFTVVFFEFGENLKLAADFLNKTKR
ncbi:alpha/beta hydrolase [Ulvibacterium sp.]|uniref:alpha/beta fold hydrolase n=1 Tax=Ulvibacterium sp. TaxID=2665914 RepID=UPI0026088C1D|nr:alpha/beta hydrolase [Ulvibacterium sp.]